jgi:hypothetical protein
MNRTDRLYALVEELRAVAPRPRSARWLAQRFEVCSRTVERDIGALQESGAPIYAEPGRTGGYTLDKPLTAGISGSVTETGMGLDELVGAAGPAMKVLRDELPGLGHEISLALEAIAAGSEKGGGDIVINATFIDPVDGHVIRQQVIRASQNRGQSVAALMGV